MVPLYLPEEQRTSAAAPSSPVPSTQQRSGADSRTRNNAQSSGAGMPRKQGGVQQQQQQQQRTGVSVPSAARAPAQVQQRQDDAAPATSPGSAGSRSLSSNARVQQFGRGFNGVDAQTMAAQPPVESAADVAAEMLTQTRSGQVLVEAEMSELGELAAPPMVLQPHAGGLQTHVCHPVFSTDAWVWQTSQQVLWSRHSAPTSHGRGTATPGGSAL